MTTNGLQKILKMLRETSNPETRIQALSSLRRSIIESQNFTKRMSDEEFCELCNSVLNSSIADDEKQHIEACRTLDIVLPSAKDKSFDFFSSILQINRKKRLKILLSLILLKDETLAVIACKPSVIDFLNDCFKSIQFRTMPWLSPDNADNITLLQNSENTALNENEDFEEKVVDRGLQLLNKICDLSEVGLNIRPFDLLIMDKVILLANMGHRRQRSQALLVFQQAVKNDLGMRIKSMHKDIWEKYKSTLQNVYCKRMSILVNMSTLDWAFLWETTITFIGTDLHRGSGLVNSLLKVEEYGFRSVDPNRRQAFLSWKVLIDNFALEQRELATNRRIKLLCTPLYAKNSKTELMVITKLEVWWHLICKIYPSISELIDAVLMPYLKICFGPLDDKPLFVKKSDPNAAFGKKFYPTQNYAVDTFLQLIVCKEDQALLPASNVQKLPNPVGNSIFEQMYKIFIHCFGEIVLILAQMPDKDNESKMKICEILWENLIKRIEEYDKMKVLMYREISVVIIELIKRRFSKIQFIQDFFLIVILKNYETLASKMDFPDSTLMEFVHIFLQVDNFSCLTTNHFQSLETLLRHVIKPKNLNVYYPGTMELMQSILTVLDNARKESSNIISVCEIWVILSRIAKKYIEDSQNINEGTLIEHNFKTIESIIAFPFSSALIEDQNQLKIMADAWKQLYLQFDYQAELIVTVKPNEILDKTSNMLINYLKKNKKSCDIAILCIDGLLNTVNYDHLQISEELSPIENLIKDLISQSLRTRSFASEKLLKAVSAFLLRLFTHNIEKTAVYLKNLQPIMKSILTKNDDNNLDNEIANTWTTVIGLFKKLQKFLNYDLLFSYKSTLISAVMHQNKEISSSTLSFLDLKNNLDEKSKLVLEDVIAEYEKISAKNDCNTSEVKIKSAKKKNTSVKQIGSFLNRKSLSPASSFLQNGKENIKKISSFIEPDSQDFVVIQSDVKLDVGRLTEHQKEMLKKRRDDIPAMYNDLSVSNSQDTQEIQHWFDARTGKSPNKSIKESSNNNEVTKTTPTSFRNITQTMKNDQENTLDKSVIPPTKPSPKKSSAASVVAVPTAAASQPSATTAVEERPTDTAAASVLQPPPVVAKKLDFDSREEFPPGEPDTANSAKMRRKSTGGGILNTEEQQPIGKQIRSTRRSLQLGGNGVPLRKFNSTDQLNNRRGKKRRTSETNSEGALDIEREKRPRRDIPESIEEDSDNSPDINGKKISKRQLNEMSRLKIDMVFKPLPSRRSAGKLSESSDKKTSVFNKMHQSNTARKLATDKVQHTFNNADKKSSVGQSKIILQSVDSKIFNKSDKFKDDNKLEDDQIDSTQSHQTNLLKRKLTEVNVTEDTAEQEKDNIKIGNNAKTFNKSTARKSCKEPIVSFKRKIEETQEEIYIEDVSTPAESSEKSPPKTSPVKSPVKSSPLKSPSKSPSPLKTSPSETDISSGSDPKSSQESEIDFVESSQEPSINSKIDKVDQCFIKIQKVEVAQQKAIIVMDEKIERNDKIIDSSASADDSSLSVIPATAESDSKCSAAQPETKKTESSSSANCSSSTNYPSSSSYNSSPKTSRLFKPRFPLVRNRAAQMLGLATGSISIPQLSSSCSTSSDKSSLINSSDDISIVALSKKEKSDKEVLRISSPVSSSRQEKMFNNMNNVHIRSERCSSPSPFCNLKNDGEKVSPKMDKNEKETESIETEIGEDSLNCRFRRELPMLEWSNANPPSLSASPSASILKRMQELDSERSLETPNRKKRVSFADPPVSREMGYEIMTENSSPPRLEKLPTNRSPTSRKDTRRQSKLRLIQLEFEKSEKENDLVSYGSLELKPSESNSMISITPKMKLTTVIDEISNEESKLSRNKETTQSQSVPESDMIVNCSVSLSSENPTKNDNDPEKIINQQQEELEDTVDVANITDFSNSTLSSFRMAGSQPNSESDTLPVTDSVFSNPSQDTQSNVAKLIEPEKLDSTARVFPSLINCTDTIDSVCADLVDPLFISNLHRHFDIKFIRSVGDLAKLTERDVNRLPIKAPKLDCIKKALCRYEEKLKTKTPDRKPTPNVSSSTPLRKRSDRTKISDESFNVDELNVSAVQYETRKSFKRTSSDTSIQTSPIKRSKKEEEKVCAEMMDRCDEEFLFETLLNKFGAEKILEGYKEKMKEKTQQELKKETLNMLGLSLEDDSEASFEASTKTAGLQKVLKQLPKIFESDEEFYETVLKTYKKKLKPAEIFKVLKTNDIQDTIIDEFDTTKLLNILNRRIDIEITNGNKLCDSNELQSLLRHVLPSSIIKQVKERDELKTTEIFKIISEHFDVLELYDLCHEILKSEIRKRLSK